MSKNMDSSATEEPTSPGDSAAGELFSDILAASVGTFTPTTLAERIAYAKSQMWKAWADYTDWRRRFELLEREQSEEYRRLCDAPAVSPDKGKGQIVADEQEGDS